MQKTLPFKSISYLLWPQKESSTSQTFLISTPAFPLNIGCNISFFGSRNLFSGIIWKQKEKTNGLTTFFKNFMLCNGIKSSAAILISIRYFKFYVCF